MPTTPGPMTNPEYLELLRSTLVSPLTDFGKILLGLSEHNRIADSDDHLAHPSPCFECETQKLLSRCVQYGSALLYVERTGTGTRA